MKRVALKGLAARPVRTLLTTLAIVLGVAMVSAAFTLTDTMRHGADSLSTAAYDGTAAVVTAPTAFKVDSGDWTASRPTVPASLLAKVRAVPQAGVAVGDINDQAKIVGRNGKPAGDGPYFGVGFDAGVPGAAATTPFRLSAGRWAHGPGEVVIDAATAEKEHYALGTRVHVTTPGAADAYTVVGIARFGDVKALGSATAAVFDLATAQKVFHKQDRYDGILVAGRPGVPTAEVRSAVTAAVGSAGRVQSAAAQDRFTLDGLKKFISIIQAVLLAFGLVAVLVGAFTIFNTLSITIAQRSREFGLLRMIGAGRRQVLGSVMIEALAVGLLASAIGLGAGLGVAMGLHALFDAMQLSLPEAGTVFAAHTVVISMLVGTIVTLAAGILPAWRATRIAPVAALRDAAPGSQRLRLPARAVRGLVSIVGRPAERIGGSAGRLARRNAMRMPGRTAVTASAMTIGVALVTLVTVVATGLHESTSGTLTKRIGATHVVTGADGFSPTDPKVAAAIAAAPGVRQVTSIRQDVTMALGDKETVNSIEPRSVGGLLSFEWADGSDRVASTLDDGGAIVDDGWAKAHHLAVGDRFSITSATGHTLALTVRGIEGSPVLDPSGLGPITITESAFTKAFVSRKDFLTLASAAPGADVAAALKPYPDAKALTTKAYVANVTQFITQLLAIFYVLLALAVIVSLFGIVNTLVLSTFERTRELGMLRSIGMTRRQVRRMVRHESVITALIGAGTGIAVGVALAGIVTAMFAKDGLTFALPVTSLVGVIVVAIGAGVLAAILPARRAARLDPLTALAYE